MVSRPSFCSRRKSRRKSGVSSAGSRRASAATRRTSEWSIGTSPASMRRTRSASAATRPCSILTARRMPSRCCVSCVAAVSPAALTLVAWSTAIRSASSVWIEYVHSTSAATGSPPPGPTRISASYNLTGSVRLLGSTAASSSRKTGDSFSVWKIPVCSPSSPSRGAAPPVEYQPTTSRFLKTSLYCRVRSSMKVCSTATPAPPSPAVYLSSNELHTSTVRPDCLPSSSPTARPPALGQAPTLTRVWWSDTLHSTSGCSRYAAPPERTEERGVRK
mmetsp:Transcript_11532/g.35642  ORF Transcript_11532/g.35642 Transcript_11532/m.35642 type:complete len:275 (+) Transcript_11532:361-1185(+)